MGHYDTLNLLQRKNPNASVKIATVQQKACLFHKSKSNATVQRCFRLEYQNFQSPSKAPSSVNMSNFKEQAMCIIGKVLDDHQSQRKLLNE
ncbi:hypothetical protein AVEN_48933-1 [Araneus ventricosus]|uniref:DUF4817 domain-containing protein n=1 Tax=Araneus ventricosus TaxID=182803 RepID=A0A4Y2AI37_ARAVE|nr:hypothetical protein AVEN_48933-1 [Araneus ventricosus]